MIYQFIYSLISLSALLSVYTTFESIKGFMSYPYYVYQATRLAGWLVDRLAGWLVDRLAGWRTCWLAGGLPFRVSTRPPVLQFVFAVSFQVTQNGHGYGFLFRDNRKMCPVLKFGQKKKANKTPIPSFRAYRTSVASYEPRVCPQ